jgi:hypothetical protein
MSRPLYIAKESGMAASGSHYTILQDDTSSYHITVSRGDYVLYEHFTNIQSRDNMLLFINKLEEELMTTFSIGQTIDITV